MRRCNDCGKWIEADYDAPCPICGPGSPADPDGAPPPGFRPSPRDRLDALAAPGLDELQVASPEEDRQRAELRRRRLLRAFGTIFGTLVVLILGATCAGYLGQRHLGGPEPSFLGASRTAALAVGLGAVGGAMLSCGWIASQGMDALMYGGEADLPNDPLPWCGGFCLALAGLAPVGMFGEQRPGLWPYVLAVCLPIAVGGIVLLLRALRPLPPVGAGRKPLRD